MSPNVSGIFFVFLSLVTVGGREFSGEFHEVGTRGVCFFSQQEKQLLTSPPKSIAVPEYHGTNERQLNF